MKDFNNPLPSLCQFHGNGNPNDELVLFEFAEMQEAITAEKVCRIF